jgi:hypothetical protein
MTNRPTVVTPRGYSLPETAAWFLGGAVVTFPFSASLARLTTKVDFAEVILTGMLVPCFTWLVQGAAAFLMSPAQRRLYWGDLGRVCFWGSFVLFPVAIFNFTVVDPPRWPSAVNVLVSVWYMTNELLLRSKRHGIAWVWPLSFLPTICVNMGLFLAASRHWWVR